ncbi:MAG: DJ-1/PfpI family protein [Leptolyngbyaceae cyanobacterium SM1_1_3]|nr:DJ-1/PfpI family protein [Leptolyngbyaceae cyanobacterium SM1_1_3]NJN02908.1 DJ-1/PfpI family protein [Leptolyngbyaceae cyanobacterium RM1_1_2]NJO09441.1 DJ-1/PfpI family protein [Leptolyngbyaceae cyanobacterium SL_1_1]
MNLQNLEKLSVAIFIFPEVEVLDFAGPFEVFSRTRLVAGVESRRSDESAPFRVFTVAKTADVVSAVGGLRVVPDYDFATAPQIDLLVVPGGFGTRSLLRDQACLDWILQVHQQATQVTSVCTGALLLAKLGLLKNKRATTHWGALDFLETLDNTIVVERQQRVVHDGIVTSAGISAGIDMSLSVVEALFSREVADETAHYMEFIRSR